MKKVTTDKILTKKIALNMVRSLLVKFNEDYRENNPDSPAALVEEIENICNNLALKLDNELTKLSPGNKYEDSYNLH